VVSPVFLLASERSGTNLLRRRISERQNTILGPSPLHFLKHLHYAEPYYGDLNKNDNFLRYIADGLGLAYHHFSPWDVRFEPADILDAYPDLVEGKRTSVGIMHTLYTLYAKSKGYSTYFCKDNNLFDFVSEIQSEIEGARFIYLHRDPRDVVLSQQKRPFQNHGIAYLSCLWRDEQIKCIKHANSLSKSGSLIKISYENLVRDESEILKQLSTFLRIKMSAPNQEVFAEERTDIQEWANLNSPTIQDNFGKFKQKLSASVIRKIESVCWFQMHWLDYEPVHSLRPVYSKKRQVIERAFSGFERVLRSRIGKGRVNRSQADRSNYVLELRRKWH